MNRYRAGAGWYELGDQSEETTLQAIARVMREHSLTVVSLREHTINHGWEIEFEGSYEGCANFLASDDGGNYEGDLTALVTPV